jgi:TRAP-type C4-dicarboxylate transport system substrate-binding protein
MRFKLEIFVALILLSAASPLQAQQLKIASIAPEGSVWMVEMRKAAEEIEEQTDGRVTFRFYGGGVQGNDTQVMRKMRIGQLHGATFTTGELGDFAREAEIYALPMVFNNYQEVMHVRKQMDAGLRQALEDAGKVNFGFSGGGFGYLMSNSPVATLDDMSRQKTWVQEGNELVYSSFKALGISPVSMPLTDVLTGLQTELLDSVSIPPMVAIVLQLHTKLKYLTDMPLAYIYGALIIEEKFFSRLSEADQGVVREVMEQAYRRLDEASMSDHEAALRALQEAGLELVPVDPQEPLKWRGKLEASNRELAASGEVSQAAMEEMMTHLAEYRASQGQ